MTKPQLYSFQQYALSSDPRFPQIGDEFNDAWSEDQPTIMLNGEPQKHVRWCVTGNPGMISLWAKENGRFVVDETTDAPNTNFDEDSLKSLSKHQTLDHQPQRPP